MKPSSNKTAKMLFSGSTFTRKLSKENTHQNICRFYQKECNKYVAYKLGRDYDLFIAFIFIKNKLAHMKPSALANDINVFLQ